MMFRLNSLLVSIAAVALGSAAPLASAQDKPLYKVVDGYKVDANTMKGFRTWRAAACDRCHGANQEGMVGPSLITSLKALSKEDFVTTVRDGRVAAWRAGSRHRQPRSLFLVRSVHLLDDRLGMRPGIRRAHVPAGLDAPIPHAVVGRLLGGLRGRLLPIEWPGSSRAASRTGVFCRT